MIKIGDKVKFLNDVGGGVVTGFVNKTTVNVEREDGFEVPYPIKELVNVSAPGIASESPAEEPEVNSSVEENREEPVFLAAEGEKINGKDAPEFYLCFVPANPKNPIEQGIEVFIVNDSNYTLLYRYAYVSADEVETVKQGVIVSNSREKVDSLTRDDLSDLPDFGIQLIYFKEKEADWNAPIVKKFRVNPVKFYKESVFRPNTFFRRNAMILKITSDILGTELDKLTTNDVRKIVKAKEQESEPQKQTVKKSTAEEIVVDLHIGELLDDYQGLSNREILEVQINAVEAAMNAAIKSKARRIVFIHGVGQGVLKQEVANVLRRKFKKYHFQDASFKEYGYGATMVILRR